VVDLGAAPGGWSEMAASAWASAKAGRGDRSARDGPMPALTSCKLDFLDPTAPEKLHACWAAAPMSCFRHGGKRKPVKEDRSAQSHALVEAGIEFAAKCCVRAAAFSPSAARRHDPPLLAALQRDFAVVSTVKPQASRADSAELYLLAMGFRGGK